MGDVCPVCNADSWHLAWCPRGPGDAPRIDAGIGFGKKLSDAEKERERRQREAAELLKRAEPPKGPA